MILFFLAFDKSQKRISLVLYTFIKLLLQRMANCITKCSAK
jgi:hypothetical protein